MSTLAIDIGGANLKFANDAGEAWAMPFALWQNSEVLASQLLEQFVIAEPTRVLATMTGELCDCFTSRAEGVGFILDHLEAAADQLPVHVWASNRGFIDPRDARAAPYTVASANWHALGTWLAPLFSTGRSLIVDIGSTTTDLLLLEDGWLATTSRTDSDRLATGELVYLGAQRTPLMALGDTITVNGTDYGVMAERFATLGDALLLTGDLTEEEAPPETPDDGEFAPDAAARRLLRMIGGEIDAFGRPAADALAQQYRRRALDRLSAATHSVLGQTPPDRVIIAGSGAPLAHALAEHNWPDARRLALAEKIGDAPARAACAHALIQLWQRQT